MELYWTKFIHVYQWWLVEYDKMITCIRESIPNCLTFQPGFVCMFQASQIAHLVRDYMLELQARYMLAPSETQQRMSHAFDLEDLERHANF